MHDNQLLRYSRHILIEEIGINVQQRFLDSHAIVIGIGGLGSPATMYLAASGIGTITLADADTVDLTNLQRQILHTIESVGLPKTESARIALKRLNPDVNIHTVSEYVDDEWLDKNVGTANIVLDCSDNLATRYAINRACVKHRIPLVSGSALRFDGQISTFDFRSPESPCYACLFQEDQPFEKIACATMGVFSPAVGIIGTMQAAEGLRVIGKIGITLEGRLMILNSLLMEWATIRLIKRNDCFVCHRTDG
ncbi:MAG: HesA/MoeB/ThiF family protein [Burkholderia sp.]|nr:HesA/MoeB/ThiF family protein [Burkholderia sp.]